MIHTPKARELGLPWTANRDGDDNWIRDARGFHLAYRHRGEGQLSASVQCVNLVGPHLDDAERMVVIRAVAGMDADTFPIFLDYLKQEGWVETR